MTTDNEPMDLADALKDPAAFVAGMVEERTVHNSPRPAWQVEGERLRAWEADAREKYRALGISKEHLRAAVTVEDEYPRRDRWTSIMRVAGPVTAVVNYVGAVLETDTCTPQYEHMLWQLAKVTEENGFALVRLSKSHYAGD